MKRAKYDKTLPRRLYQFFRTYDEKCGAPSLSKFAVANGYTVEDLLSFCQHSAFASAYRAACEIRRDYLIDRALCRQFDGSFVKYLLTEEVASQASGEENGLELTLRVVDG